MNLCDDEGLINTKQMDLSYSSVETLFNEGEFLNKITLLS